MPRVIRSKGTSPAAKSPAAREQAAAGSPSATLACSPSSSSSPLFSSDFRCLLQFRPSAPSLSDVHDWMANQPSHATVCSKPILPASLSALTSRELTSYDKLSGSKFAAGALAVSHSSSSDDKSVHSSNELQVPLPSIQTDVSKAKSSINNLSPLKSTKSSDAASHPPPSSKGSEKMLDERKEKSNHANGGKDVFRFPSQSSASQKSSTEEKGAPISIDSKSAPSSNSSLKPQTIIVIESDEEDESDVTALPLVAEAHTVNELDEPVVLPAPADQSSPASRSLSKNESDVVLIIPPSESTSNSTPASVPAQSSMSTGSGGAVDGAVILSSSGTRDFLIPPPSQSTRSLPSNPNYSLHPQSILPSMAQLQPQQSAMHISPPQSPQQSNVIDVNAARVAMFDLAMGNELPSDASMEQEAAAANAESKSPSQAHHIAAGTISQSIPNMASAEIGSASLNLPSATRPLAQQRDHDQHRRRMPSPPTLYSTASAAPPTHSIKPATQAPQLADETPSHGSLELAHNLPSGPSSAPPSSVPVTSQASRLPHSQQNSTHQFDSLPPEGFDNGEAGEGSMLDEPLSPLELHFSAPPSAEENNRSMPTRMPSMSLHLTASTQEPMQEELQQDAAEMEVEDEGADREEKQEQKTEDDEKMQDVQENSQSSDHNPRSVSQPVETAAPIRAVTPPIRHSSSPSAPPSASKRSVVSSEAVTLVMQHHPPLPPLPPLHPQSQQQTQQQESQGNTGEPASTPPTAFTPTVVVTPATAGKSKSVSADEVRSTIVHTVSPAKSLSSPIRSAHSSTAATIVQRSSISNHMQPKELDFENDKSSVININRSNTQRTAGSAAAMAAPHASNSNILTSKPQSDDVPFVVGSPADFFTQTPLTPAHPAEASQSQAHNSSSPNRNKSSAQHASENETPSIARATMDPATVNHIEVPPPTAIADLATSESASAQEPPVVSIAPWRKSMPAPTAISQDEVVVIEQPSTLAAASSDAATAVSKRRGKTFNKQTRVTDSETRPMVSLVSSKPLNYSSYQSESEMVPVAAELESQAEDSVDPLKRARHARLADKEQHPEQASSETRSILRSSKFDEEEIEFSIPQTEVLEEPQRARSPPSEISNHAAANSTPTTVPPKLRFTPTPPPIVSPSPPPLLSPPPPPPPPPPSSLSPALLSPTPAQRNSLSRRGIAASHKKITVDIKYKVSPTGKSLDISSPTTPQKPPSPVTVSPPKSISPGPNATTNRAADPAALSVILEETSSNASSMSKPAMVRPVTAAVSSPQQCSAQATSMDIDEGAPLPQLVTGTGTSKSTHAKRTGASDIRVSSSEDAHAVEQGAAVSSSSSHEAVGSKRKSLSSTEEDREPPKRTRRSTSPESSNVASSTAAAPSCVPRPVSACVAAVASSSSSVVTPVSAPAYSRKTLFKGIQFLITGFSSKSEMNKDKLADHLQSCGGVVLETLDSVSPPSNTTLMNPQIVVLASEPMRTMKFLFSLARGLAPLKIDWIERCEQHKRIVDPELADGVPLKMDDGVVMPIPSHWKRRMHEGMLYPAAVEKRLLYGMQILVVDVPAEVAVVCREAGATVWSATEGKAVEWKNWSAPDEAPIAATADAKSGRNRRNPASVLDLPQFEVILIKEPENLSERIKKQLLAGPPAAAGASSSKASKRKMPTTVVKIGWLTESLLAQKKLSIDAFIK